MPIEKIKYPTIKKDPHLVRYNNTLKFMSDLNLKKDQILNLGPDNPLSDLLTKNGYKITNTSEHEDLDFEYEIVENEKFNTVIAFEIFEHMVSPFPLLKNIKANKLIASVPLALWFSKAYWNEDDPYDRHYHEFEPRQFKMLLNKANWKIKKEEKHTSTSFKIGFRPILRMMTPRHYFVYCERT